MKKGFTLIELLAVIVILAIILLIAVPQVLDVIESARISSNNETQSMVVKATKTYLSLNESLLPNEEGETVEISLDTLESGLYISKVTNNNDSCSGYVLVTKVDEDYIYNPLIKCGLSTEVVSPLTDNLTLYYEFDSNEEGTKNLISTPLGDYLVGYTGLSVSKIDDLSTLSGTAAKAVLTVDEINDAARVRFGNSEFITADPDYLTKEYFVSVYLKKDPTVLVDNIRPRVYTGYNWYNMYALEGGSNYLENEYKRFGLKVRLAANSGGPAPAFGMFTYDVNVGETFYISSPQLEERIFATPFTANEHVGNIVDISNNENDGEIYSVNSPIWKEENNNTIYSFDGVDDYIKVDNTSFINETEGTIVINFKPNESTEKQILFIGGTSDASYTTGTDKLFLAYNGASNFVTGGWVTASEMDYAIATDSIIENEWNNIILSWSADLNESFAYINGERIQRDCFTLNNKTNWENYFMIGRAMLGATTNDAFDGEIDNVKVYSRILTEEEAKYQYEMDSFNYR